MRSLLPDSLLEPGAPPRTLVEALRQEPIQPARIESAYLRFLRRRAATSAPRRGPRVVRHAAFAVLMAVGAVYAATVTRSLQPAEVQPPAEAPSFPPPKVSPPRPAVVQPQAAPQQEASSPEPETPPATPLDPTTSVRGQPVRSPAPVPSAEQWKRAAQGLRDGDFQRADAALRQLARSGTEADRESALLVQAQVLLAKGREAEAQSLLKSLEGSRSPSVRRKSVELLARLRDRPAARSDKARAATGAP